MRARKVVWLGLLAAGVLGTGTALAVSDGNYTNARNNCSGGAFNSDSPDRAEAGCNALVFKVTDGRHNYVYVGVPETADGHRQNTVNACVDLGTGHRYCLQYVKGQKPTLTTLAGTPAHPGSGIHTYFGANDNLDGGEHDSSSQVDNGPSDGGGFQVNVTPWTLSTWVNDIKNGNKSDLLTHPLPLGDAGIGFCADGFCFSAQTERRVAYEGTNTDPNSDRDVADYGAHQWDPESCSGATGDDDAEHCGGHPITYWEEQNGKTYVEPGIQIYEDPDPQGSPIIQYPIPALYVGTCGLVIGGGNVDAPPSPFTNPSGQLVVKTGC
ncbi:MAG: hypothetical protein ACJ735_09285 [Actinomycetes bacterium]